MDATSWRSSGSVPRYILYPTSRLPFSNSGRFQSKVSWPLPAAILRYLGSDGGALGMMDIVSVGVLFP